MRGNCCIERGDNFFYISTVYYSPILKKRGIPTMPTIHEFIGKEDLIEI
jgi:hypothetical protein